MLESPKNHLIAHTTIPPVHTTRRDYLGGLEEQHYLCTVKLKQREMFEKRMNQEKWNSNMIIYEKK